MAAAVAVLITLSVSMSAFQRQARVIAEEAAPQAATASDLYFALSDLDTQVARLVLIDNAPALAGTQVDALGTYQSRNAQIDADLQRAVATTANAADRVAALKLADDLAVYRMWAWQALTVESQQPTGPPGQLPPAALGYYTQATNVLHLDLLPTAEQLRNASQRRLDDTYAAQRTTRIVGTVLTLVLGGLLVALLLILQAWVTRRFRRIMNPLLLASTLVTLVLVAAACVVFTVVGSRLESARHNDLNPYLDLSHTQAISYDLAADTSRYLIFANLAYYDQDFTTKSANLVNTALPPGDLVDRWRAYERDHKKIVDMANAGQTDAAIKALTGIQRADAAFDFSYFDAAISQQTASHKQAFDRETDHARGLLTGWVYLPIVAMGLVLLFTALAARRRLQEYR
jgi:hypothetical protein